MNIYIDESGTFGWRNPGVSLFCGVVVPGRASEALFGRFAQWRQSLIGESRREIKGSELTGPQLSSFVSQVLPSNDRDIWLACRGINTYITQEGVVLRLKEQAAIILDECSRIAERHNNARLQEQYRQMCGWMNNRSAQNLLWLIGAADVVIDSLTAAVVRFLEPGDDSEFEKLAITLDQSFIKRDQHHDFWKEWLRSEITKSSRQDGVPNVKQWRERNHPFYRKTSIYPNLMSWHSIVHEDMQFGNSKEMPGLQIADICANILLRHHRRSEDKDSYSQLEHRIVGKHGVTMTLTHVSEESLHKDDPRLHAGVLNVEEIKRQADALGTA